MVTAWAYWTAEIAGRLSKQLDRDVEPKDLVAPPDPALGDLAFGCFRLAKEWKKNPVEVAKEIEKGFKIKNTDIASVAAAGPFVNFTFATGDVVHRVIADIEAANDTYGRNKTGKNQELLLEYATPNTHKEIHVGHLRNFVIGAALDHLLSASGWNVVPLSYHGDVGAHVAKCLWMLAEPSPYEGEGRVRSKRPTVEDVAAILKKIPAANRTGKYLGQIYAEATKALEENPDAKADVSIVQQKLEAHDKAWEKLWRETRQWSVDEMKEIFDELGVHIDRQYFESEVVDRGQEIVDELLKKKIAKESEGAIIVDLEDKKLGVFLIRKSDGTSLYATKDLALAELKTKEYPDAVRSLFVNDNRQQLYFKQLFETLRRMEVGCPAEFVGYEFVTLKTGAMSSREGNIVSYESFRDSVIDFAKQEILKRHEDWSVGQIEDTAWKLAMAGIKFGMLKQDNDRIFTFDLEQALSFEGATGPYCQYAATRLGSILKKASYPPPRRGGVRGGVGAADLTRAFDHASEKRLALALAAFPSKVEQAAKELRPSVVAQWCLETSQRINDFYRDVPVLESQGELLAGRLRLSTAARSTLSKGLELLGIAVPEQM